MREQIGLTHHFIIVKIHTYIQTYVHTYIHMYIHIYIHTISLGKQCTCAQWQGSSEGYPQ